MTHVTLNSITELRDFKPFDNPIELNGYTAMGYFPYEVAQLDSQECVAVPRTLFRSLENVLYERGYSDNKIVVVFKDKTNFGTKDFAIQFKDSYCKMGKLSQIQGYAGSILK